MINFILLSFLVWGWTGCTTFIYSVYKNHETIRLIEILPLLYLGFKHGPFTVFLVDFNNGE